MVFIVDSHGPSYGVRAVLKLFLSSTKNLVLCYKYMLQILCYIDGKLLIMEKTNFEFEIEAAVAVQSLNAVIVLLENKISCITLLNGAERLWTVEISDAPTQATPLECGPRLFYLKQYNIVLVHKYLSYVTQIHLDRLPGLDGIIKDLRGHPSETSWIGDNIIHLITQLRGRGLGFNTISRDFDFNYIAHDYNWDDCLYHHEITLRVVGVPSLVILAAGGSMLVTDLALHFYPFGIADLLDNAGSSDFPVSICPRSDPNFQQRILLDMTECGAPFRGTSFQAHVLIRRAKSDIHSGDLDDEWSLDLEIEDDDDDLDPDLDLDSNRYPFNGQFSGGDYPHLERNSDKLMVPLVKYKLEQKLDDAVQSGFQTRPRRMRYYKERHLLISDTGETMLVYIKARYSERNHRTTVDHFRVVCLGKTTIATSLVQITSSIFFAGSQVSQSVLFEVLDKKPYIHILRKHRSSPPIQDLSFVQGGEIPTIVLGQGGLHCGEVLLFTDLPDKVQRLMSVTLAAPAVLTEMGKPGFNNFLFTASAFDTRCEYLVLFRPLGVKLAGQVREWKEVPLQATCADLSVATVRGHRLLYQNCSLDLPELIDPSMIIIVGGKRRVDIVVCLTSNTVYHAWWSNAGLSLLRYTKLSTAGALTVAFFLKQSGPPHVVAASTSGEVFHFFPDGGLVKMKITDVQGILRVKNSSYKNDCLLLYDSLRVWHLKLSRYSSCFKPKLLFRSEKPITDCLYLEERNTVLLFDGSTKMELRKLFSDQPEYVKVYLSATVHKSKAVSGYIVTLESDRVFENDSVVTKPYMKLYNPDLTLECTLNLDSTYADLCELKDVTLDPESSCAIAAVAATAKHLDIYVIKKGLLQLYKSFPFASIFRGRSTYPLSEVHLIHYQDEFITLLGDFVVLMVLLVTNGRILWRAIQGLSPWSYAVGYVKDGGDAVVADVSAGLLWNTGLGDFCKLLLPFEPQFITAVGLIKNRHMIVYGDSMGNLVCARMAIPPEQCEEVFSINVGSQINVITVDEGEPVSIIVGLSSGEIYRLFETNIFSLSDLSKVMGRSDFVGKPLRSIEGKKLREGRGVVDASDALDHIQFNDEDLGMLELKKVYQGLLWCDVFEFS